MAGRKSKLEINLQRLLSTDWKYHGKYIDYRIESTYEVDFCKYIEEEDKYIYIEAKGYFRSLAEPKKYISVRNYLQDNEELVFVFDNPKKAMPCARKRKNGTKQSMGEWAERNGFKYYTLFTLPEEFKE